MSKKETLIENFNNSQWNFWSKILIKKPLGIIISLILVFIMIISFIFAGLYGGLFVWLFITLVLGPAILLIPFSLFLLTSYFRYKGDVNCIIDKNTIICK